MGKQLTFGLLLSILMVIAPHAEHLPPWVSSLCAVLLLWRAWLAYSGKPLAKRWLLMLITFAGVAGIALDFRSLFGREVGVTLLVLLAALKLMETRTPRDAMVLVYLACFIIITNFFYSQSIPTALYMLASLVVVIATWVHLHAQNIALKPCLRVASMLLLQALPLTLILFILFPRVQGPLWGLPQDAFASSGLDDKMAPGSLSRLILSEAVAFRVTYESEPPPRNQMYWRGPVLWEYDGRTWTAGKMGPSGRAALTPAPDFSGLGQKIDYVVTLEPHNKHWLFALEMPGKLSVPSLLTNDFQVLRKEPVTARLRYAASSNLSYRANLQEAQRQLQRGLQIPKQFNPRAQQLAKEWRAQAEAAPPPQPPLGGKLEGGNGRGGNRSLAGIDEAIVRTALAYFNRETFQYTLEPPLLGIHGVDEFLFESRQGFCEHYASSFVFLMRAANIPARVVTGYLGGEFNNFGNYYIVRQLDAHAWAEVWLEGQGWVRVDPTAYIAPERVQRNLSAAVANNAALPFMVRNPPQWLLNLRLNWDALANQWNQWVLGYDSERQFAFLTRMGMEDITWQKIALNMLAGLGLVIALFALFMLRHLIRRQPDKVQAAWLKLCRKLAKAGLSRAAHEGAINYAARIAVARPELAVAMQDLAARYVALRYCNAENSGEAQKEFSRRIAHFPPLPRTR